MENTKPSDLEMQILSVLWSSGPSTARQVLSSMPDKKARAYTTILSSMQVMEKKGLLTHSTKGIAHVFRPTRTKDQTLKPFIRKMVDEIFLGKPANLIQALLVDENVSQNEIDEIKKIIENASTSTDNTK